MAAVCYAFYQPVLANCPHLNKNNKKKEIKYEKEKDNFLNMFKSILYSRQVFKLHRPEAKTLNRDRRVATKVHQGIIILYKHPILSYILS